MRLPRPTPTPTEHGAPLFCAERRVPKDFRQSRMVGGRKVYQLGDVRRVLYRLPRVIEAARNGRAIWICEGEKDVHALELAGVTATCNPGGAGKWREEFGEALAGVDMIVVADRDQPGRRSRRPGGGEPARPRESVRVVEAAEGKDAADHLAAGHGLGDFREPQPGEDGAQLLDDVLVFLTSYVAFPSFAAAVAVTLWAAHTHLVRRFDTTPRLALVSPEKRCGKSRVLELLELLSPR